MPRRNAGRTRHAAACRSHSSCAMNRKDQGSAPPRRTLPPRPSPRGQGEAMPPADMAALTGAAPVAPTAPAPAASSRPLPGETAAACPRTGGLLSMLIYSRIATPPRCWLYGKDGILRQRRALRRVLGKMAGLCCEALGAAPGVSPGRALPSVRGGVFEGV